MQDNNNIMKQTSAMWRYIKVPDKPEPHTEYDSQYAHLPGGVMMGARVRGKKHKHDGTNCDDWFEIGFCNDWTVIAVSDGAGSRKLSRIGARESCQAAVNNITGVLSDFGDIKSEFEDSLAKPLNSKEFGESCGYLANVLQNCMKTVYKSVEKAAQLRKTIVSVREFLGREPNINDFAATLILALIVPVKIGDKSENVIITLQIGDGAIFAVDSKSEFKSASRVLSDSDANGHFAGETEFLSEKTSQNLTNKTRVYRGPADTVMVMTDGVADDYFPYEDGAKRLYLDLLANMIITNRRRLSKEVMEKIAQNIPRPIVYPWVNDPTVKVSLQYVSAMVKSIDCPLSYIWDNPGILSYYTRYITPPKVKDRGERLLTWLDNYNERGSFDDRTLVVFMRSDG